MPKLRTKTILAPEKDFLAFPDHYVSLPGKIAYATLSSVAKEDNDFGGAKTLKRGTVVKMDDEGTVTAAASNDGNGIIFNTIKLDDYDKDTDPYINVAVLVHGFVRADRLDGEDQLKANDLIYVVKA